MVYCAHFIMEVDSQDEEDFVLQMKVDSVKLSIYDGKPLNSNSANLFTDNFTNVATHSFNYNYFYWSLFQGLYCTETISSGSTLVTPHQGFLLRHMGHLLSITHLMIYSLTLILMLAIPSLCSWRMLVNVVCNDWPVFCPMTSCQGQEFMGITCSHSVIQSHILLARYSFRS